MVFAFLDPTYDLNVLVCCVFHSIKTNTMATVLPNLKVSVSLEQKQPSVDEEVGIESKVSIEKTSWGLPLFACIVIFSLTVCLSIGLRPYGHGLR